jgi:hypothetical protein
MLAKIRRDLHRPHDFAHERVGFMTAGATRVGSHELLLMAREYRPVADEDYEPDLTVGVRIGSNAMRKAAQFAYQSRSTLLHVHSHGGYGRPDFSGVDVKSGREFVPGFFHSVPRMPHGMIVLSNDSATCMLWFDPEEDGTYAAEFIGVGAPFRRFGARP